MAHRWPYDERSVACWLPVATVALTVGPEPSDNREHLVEMVRRAKAEHPDVRLVHFGEVTLGWLSKGKETQAYYQSIAEPIPGTTTEALVRVARELGVYVSFGMVERHERGLSNTQVVLDPDGEILVMHRKVNLRFKFLVPGERKANVFSIDTVRCTIMICYDMQGFLFGRKVHRARPEVILYSLADNERSWFAAQHTATRFDAWIVCSNRYGAEPKYRWPGQIFVSDPLGRIRARSLDGEKILYYRIPIVRKHGRIAWFVRRTLMTMRLVALIAVNLHVGWGFAADRIRMLTRRKKRTATKDQA
jgi:predicted amidohydrolase